MQIAQTIAEVREYDKKITESSKYFSPLYSEKSSHPVQVLWELFLGAVGGAVTGGIIGGNPKLGAATGVVGQAIRMIQRDADFGQILFGKGTFDLARRVIREIERGDL